MSETEPELGLGLVLACNQRELEIEFRQVDLRRRYVQKSAPLRRVRFAVGETIATRDGRRLTVEAVDERGALLVYTTAAGAIVESELADTAGEASLEERLRRGDVDPPRRLGLRIDALCRRAEFDGSPLRGLRGGRIQLLPHQLRVVNEVTSRHAPRVLLADEVGLGKTIEAALIVHRLIRTGRAERVLFLVPEALIHQWLVELVRRFAIWPALYDEDRCAGAESSAPGNNPFLAEPVILTSLDLLLERPARLVQACAAGFDVVVVDEAHHLRWSPQEPSPAWSLVDQLGRRAPAMILASATPERAGTLGHYARLRLLDPQRFDDPTRFEAEESAWVALADLVDLLLGDGAVPADLADRLPSDPSGGLRRGARAALAGDAVAREQLALDLLDRHGPGRLIFRSTRAAVGGFPARLPRLHRLTHPSAPPNEPDRAPADYRDDPRIAWIADLLRAAPDDKIMVVCRRVDQVRAIDAALAARIRVDTALFHEDSSLVQRDRLAAWFDDPAGARLLICSEIGSEGRNMQSARRLVLFDLPDDADVLEQRIGRLDRIGRVGDVQIEIPFLAGMAGERRARFFHEALDAFSLPRPAAGAVLRALGNELRPWFDEAETGSAAARDPKAEATAFGSLLARARVLAEQLDERYRLGRDRLLEHNARRSGEGQALAERLAAAEEDLPAFLAHALDAFGATLEDLGGGRVRLADDDAFVEQVPGLPAGGIVGTFDRTLALVREDLAFLTSDHPAVEALTEAITADTAGRVAAGTATGDPDLPALLALYLVEVAAPRALAAGRYLPATPLAVRVDRRGVRVLEPTAAAALARSCRPLRSNVLEETATALAPWVAERLADAAEKATGVAQSRAAAARERLEEESARALERLTALAASGAAIRPDEITALEIERDALRRVLASPEPRLDSLLLLLPQ